MKTFPIRRNPITFHWHFLKSDGTPFSLSGIDFDLFCWTGRGSSRVQSVSVIGQNMNILSWTMSKQEQIAIGTYNLSIVLKQNGNAFCKVKYQDAFALRRVPCECQATVNEESENDSQNVTIFSATEYYVSQPVIPIIGENGHWYINGEDTGKQAKGDTGETGPQGEPGPQGPVASVPIANTIPSGGMLPDVFYALGEISADPNITLVAAPADGKDHEWMLSLSIGVTAPASVTFPTSVVFPDTPTFEANKHYEVSMKWDATTSKYYGVIQSWDRV